jgi:hypothetical protein
MVEYRIYSLGSDGHIKSAVDFVVESDEEACEHARVLSQKERCVTEVCSRTLRVAVIPIPDADPCQDAAE